MHRSEVRVQRTPPSRRFSDDCAGSWASDPKGQACLAPTDLNGVSGAKGRVETSPLQTFPPYRPTPLVYRYRSMIPPSAAPPGHNVSYGRSYSGSSGSSSPSHNSCPLCSSMNSSPVAISPRA